MSRHKDIAWNLPDKPLNYEIVHAALLMDLRDELKKLNQLLHCPNFTGIPNTLHGIRMKLPTRKRRRAASKRGGK